MSLKGVTAAFILSFAVLSGCAGSGSISGKELNNGLRINQEFSNTSNSSGMIYDKWWTVLHSEELNTMMGRMFEDNYKLAQSYEGLKALYATYGISESDRALTLNAKASATGSISESNGNGVSKDSYFLGFSAAYEADIWGKLKNTSKSNLFTLISSKYDLESLYMTLSGEMAQKYITCIALKNILDVKKEGVKLYEARLDARERLYRAGVGDMTKVLEAKKSLETVQTDILLSEKSYRDALQAAALLMGHADGASIKITDKEYRIPVLPKTVPAEVAVQRPDIKSALNTVYKYDRSVAAAVAKKYPSLSFTAEAGYTNDRLGDIISPENFAAQIIGSLVLPLLDGKERELEVQKQKAFLKQNIYAYQETVITALSEVQTALNADGYYAETLTRQHNRLDSDLKLYKLAKMRYELGTDDYESVLETKIALNERLAAVLSAKKDLALARIDLITAVGGNWADEYTSKRLNDNIQELFQEQNR